MTTNNESLRAWQKMTDDVLLDAAKHSDMLDAIDHVAAAAGINDHKVAANTLAPYSGNWKGFLPSMRVRALEQWQDAERRANLDYEPPMPKKMNVTLILAGLSLLRSRNPVLPADVIDILAEDNIGAENVEDRIKLVRAIETLLERINCSSVILTEREPIAELLRFATTRAEDLDESMSNPDDPDVKRAWAAVKAGRQLLGEE